MIEKKFEDVIKKYAAGEMLAVAVSGGADSMCLLSLCLNSPHIQKENILVVSIDHKIRGENSANDLKFVRTYCENRGVKFMPFSIDIPARCKISGRGTESEAREARREIFKELVESGQANKVLLAHHASDNAESVLMHIFRGCGLNGLTGMKVLSEGYLLRPLLEVEKADIDAYLSGNRLPFITDETNADAKYTRNFIRNEVLPLVKQKYPGVERAVINLAAETEDVLQILDKNTDGLALRRNEDNQTIMLSALTDDAADAHYVLKTINGELKELIGRKHIKAIIALKRAENGKGIDLPGNYRAVKEYDCITVYKAVQPVREESEMDFSVGTTNFNGIEIRVERSGGEDGQRALRFDRGKIPDSAVFRFRRDGDIFSPFGGGTKKLKEYLIDKKIPVRLRDRLVCIADGNEILAVAGVEISEKIKVENNSDTYFLKAGVRLE